MSISDVYRGQSGLSLAGRVESGFVVREDRVLCSPLNEVSLNIFFFVCLDLSFLNYKTSFLPLILSFLISNTSFLSSILCSH